MEDNRPLWQRQRDALRAEAEAAADADDLFAVADQVEQETPADPVPIMRRAIAQIQATLDGELAPLLAPYEAPPHAPQEVQGRWWTPSPVDTYATADGQWFPVRMALTVNADHTAAWFMALNRGIWRIDTEPGPPTPETGWEYTADGLTWQPLTLTTAIATQRGEFLAVRCTTPLIRGRVVLVCHAR